MSQRDKWLTSMCMQIHPFDHADCPHPPYCSCPCHQPNEETK